MGEALAILAAVLFAFGTVLQQKGTLSTRRPATTRASCSRSCTVRSGSPARCCQSTGWVVQAMALDRGSLVVVQSLTALSLVLALPLGALLTNQHIGRREVTGAT